MLNLHRLFYTSVENDAFHNVILPSEGQKQHLTQAKNKIRDHLRGAIEQASTTLLGQANKVTPRFRTQGSWSYDLCNQPAHTPPQEMDWDLGVYLPISVWEDSRPRVAAVVYYKLLEESLRSLCAREGWTMTPKDTCIRIMIGRSCHIDVPPYAAPDKEFTTIQERALAKALALKEEAAYKEALEFGEIQGADWDSMKEIVLATRSGNWEKSDPGVVSNWFRDQVAQYGDQVRRVCRYLKAWRDFNWIEGGPTSICLMICACQSFQKMPGRDDLALFEVVRLLGDRLAVDIREELINPDEVFNKRLSTEERLAAAGMARALSQALNNALEGRQWQKIELVSAVQAQFGPRFPTNPTWVSDSTPQDVVRVAPAIIVPQPEVRRSKSG